MSPKKPNPELEDVTLRVLREYIEQNGFAPSVRELGDLLGLSSPSSVQTRLQRLVDEGKIVRVGPRAIRIAE